MKENSTKKRIISLLKANKAILKEQYGIKKIGLFGSYARGDYTELSDIDIIVDMPSDFDLYYGLKEYLEKIFKKKVDLGLERNIRNLIRYRIDREIIYV